MQGAGQGFAQRFRVVFVGYDHTDMMDIRFLGAEFPGDGQGMTMQIGIRLVQRLAGEVELGIAGGRLGKLHSQVITALPGAFREHIFHCRQQFRVSRHAAVQPVNAGIQRRSVFDLIIDGVIGIRRGAGSAQTVLQGLIKAQA